MKAVLIIHEDGSSTRFEIDPGTGLVLVGPPPKHERIPFSAAQLLSDLLDEIVAAKAKTLL